MDGTKDPEARRQTLDNVTPMPMGFTNNSNEAYDDITYDTTDPALFREQQFIRTNTREFGNLRAVLDTNARGGIRVISSSKNE
jgi:hypothetical protein